MLVNSKGVDEKKILWILGLHHSGTTIVWRCIRKDSRFLAFDEPFTSDIARWYPNNNIKKTFNEYAIKFNDPVEFWGLFEPICPLQELEGYLSERQEKYLVRLVSGEDSVVIDETKMHHYIKGVKRIFPYSKIVHLVRGARSFVTSHFIVSQRYTSPKRKIIGSIRNIYQKERFWSRMDIPGHMGRDVVIGSSTYSKFALRLREVGYDVDKIMNSSAMVRMLAYWHYHYHYLEKEGPKHFGQNFKTVWYEDFASDPERVMASLYEWLGMERPEGVRYDEVHPPKPPYKANDRRWLEAARIAGFSEEELETLL